MKTTKLMRSVLCAAVLAAFGLVGCEQLDPYSINAPSDLQDRIDSIANSKPDTGDTTYINITTTIVGAEDNSTGWNGAHSDYFTIPTNKLLHLEFVNYTSGAGNWNNWNLAVDVVKENTSDYDPNGGKIGYFTLRADAWGWGNSDFDIKMVTKDYPDTDGDGDIWNDFRLTMQGAYVTIDVDHSATGNVFVTATAVGSNGTTLTETYTQPVSATDDIASFLVCDGSHFVMKKAYLIPSKVTEVEDVNPVSIAVTGTPETVELGGTNFWGKGVATVTYEDGSSEVVDTADVSFNVIPDMTTLGTKTVVLAYSKTKQGNYSQAVSTYYNLEVTNPVVSLEVTTLPDQTKYYYYNPIVFDSRGLVVTGTYSDGSKAVIPNDVLQFSVPDAEGAQNAVISYVGETKTVKTTCPLFLVKGLSQVGAGDFSTPFWGAHSANYTVSSGESKVFTMYCYSKEGENWHNPITILRQANLTENAVVRMDNAGWGAGFGTSTNTHDWDLVTPDVFKSNINGSKVVITVTNNGDNTANVRYDVTHANGETHFQTFNGITVISSDLTCALTVENCYLVITE